MNAFAKLAVCSALLAAGPVCAQVPARGSTLEPLEIVERELPLYPHDAAQRGIREGGARVAFSVDAAGRLEDALAVAYTYPAFAEATLAAMKRWKFRPARVGGQPVAVTSMVDVRFKTEGVVVVSLTGNEHVVSLFYRLDPTGAERRPCSADELDRLPVPVAAPAPAYPASLAESGRHGDVTVDFYIDPTGRPRLASTTAGQDPQLSALAVTAVSRWQFEPPTRDGRPVLVKAAQVFRFRPEAASPTG